MDQEKEKWREKEKWNGKAKGKEKDKEKEKGKEKEKKRDKEKEKEKQREEEKEKEICKTIVNLSFELVTRSWHCCTMEDSSAPRASHMRAACAPQLSEGIKYSYLVFWKNSLHSPYLLNITDQ